MMSNGPEVSVVMPVRNALPFLDESVRSVLGQTFRDFEFVILDDASTDGSAEALRAWARRDARIRLVESGRRLGLAVAADRLEVRPPERGRAVREGRVERGPREPPAVARADAPALGVDPFAERPDEHHVGARPQHFDLAREPFGVGHVVGVHARDERGAGARDDEVRAAREAEIAPARVDPDARVPAPPLAQGGESAVGRGVV